MSKLYILVEESFRELRARAHITTAALARNLEVVIGQQWWFARNFASLSPGVVFLKGNNSVQANLMTSARAAGHRVLSIEEEAFGLKGEDVFLTLFDPRIETNCDRFLAQGINQRDTLISRFPEMWDRVSIVGNPRSEALISAASSGITGPAQEFLSRYGPYVLVNTNYASINPFDFDAFAYYRRCVGVGVLAPGDPDEMELFHTQCVWERDNLREIVRFLNMISEFRPDIPVILRPHPSENPRPWIDMARDLSSVYIVSDNDHLYWTLSCSVLVHSGSTTGLEACLLGREAINLRPGKSAWHDRFVSSIVNKNAETARQALEFVEQIYQRPTITSTPQDRIKALQPYLQTEMDSSPSELIVDSVLDIMPIGSARALEPGPFTNPYNSSRQRDKAFVSTETFRALLREATKTRSSQNFSITDLGPAVWHVTNITRTHMS
ncbi:MAG: hypothetical protein CMM47_11755 [Rhodospirillaceae bacterium]|nr:hypothetical protein [Rhodospirillaceae bacterium]